MYIQLMNMKEKKSFLFEHFKMNLYGNNGNIKDNLIATNGKEYPSSLVFIESLKHLKEQAINIFRCKRNEIKIKSNKDICWIITIPGIKNIH